MSEYDAKYIIKPIFNTTPITEEPLKMPPADGSTIPKELWKRDDSQLSVNENRSLCKLRHGRWVKDKGLYKCTACNDLLTVAGWAECIPEKQIYTAFKYCPNCGASMMDEECEDESR